MKNYEKYADEIRRYKGISLCRNFIKPYILKSDSCDDIDCGKCHMLQTIWLLEDYEEPETDWSKVAVDTPILVKDCKGENITWKKRHFAKYKDGRVYAWESGLTSWSTTRVTTWRYAKLAETEGVE